MPHTSVQSVRYGHARFFESDRLRHHFEHFGKCGAPGSFLATWGVVPGVIGNVFSGVCRVDGGEIACCCEGMGGQLVETLTAKGFVIFEDQGDFVFVEFVHAGADGVVEQEGFQLGMGGSLDTN